MVLDFMSEQDFAIRVSTAVLSKQRPVVFLLGSGATLADHSGFGVASVADIEKLVEKQLGADYKTSKSYQDAFKQLLQKRGQDAANRVIQEAVIRSRTDYKNLQQRISDFSSKEFEQLESENQKWHVPIGILAIASLCAHFPSKFGHAILTTNFDPLLEIALSRQRTPWYSSALHADGSLLYIRGVGTHVIHLHGHWWGSDTLHTSHQLTAERPQLSGSLRKLLKDMTLVVIGYGGWDDVLMSTLCSVLKSNDTDVDILWGFYSNDPQKLQRKYAHVIKSLQPAIDRGRAHLFQGICSDHTLPEIFRLATERKPAENLGSFLSRVEFTRTQSVEYPGLTKPWGDPNTSLGDYIKLLANLDLHQAVHAALFSVEYLLPQLERQDVHSAPQAKQFPWVREAIKKSLALLNGDNQHNFWLAGAVEDMFKEANNWDLNSKDQTTLRAAAQAVCACLAVASGNNEYEYNYNNSYSTKVWLARSIHCSARTLHDDDGALWSYLARRLTGGYNHLWRFD